MYYPKGKVIRILSLLCRFGTVRCSIMFLPSSLAQGYGDVKRVWLVRLVRVFYSLLISSLRTLTTVTEPRVFSFDITRTPWNSVSSSPPLPVIYRGLMSVLVLSKARHGLRVLKTCSNDISKVVIAIVCQSVKCIDFLDARGLTEHISNIHDFVLITLCTVIKFYLYYIDSVIPFYRYTSYLFFSNFYYNS